MKEANKRVGIVLLLLLFWSELSIAQNEVPRLPLQYGQYFSTYPLYNPASLGTHARIQFNAGSQVLIGPFENIHNTYAHGGIQLTPERRENNKTNHVMGFSFMDDQEGDLISRSRFYLQYAIHINLNEQLALSAGTSCGFMSYLLGSSPVSGGGSDTQIDINFGLWLYHDRFQAGVSLHQIPESELTPIQEITTLPRYININGEYQFNIDPKIRIIFSTIARWVPAYTNLNIFDFNTRAVYNDLLSVGTGYRYKRGISLNIGFENIPINENKLRAIISYNMPPQDVGLSGLNTFELTIGYGINPYFKK